MRKLSLRVGALAATALTLVALSASPALAEPALPDRTLPNVGDKLYALECNGLSHDLFEVDVASGALTPVGAESEPNSCWSQGFYNPADGMIHAVDWSSFDDNDNLYLEAIDPATGVVTHGVSLTVAGSGDMLDVYAMALSPEGTIYAYDNTALYTVDPATGISTFVGDLLLDSVAKTGFYSLAFNPADGLLYGVDWNDGNNWYTIDTADASLTVVNDTWSTATGNDTAGLAFDSTGVAWYQVDNLSSIASAVLPDIEGSTANLHEMQVDGNRVYAESLVYVPAAVVEPTPTTEPSAEAAPALAATGVDAGALTAGAGATALLMLAGASLLVARRRQNA